MPAWGHYKAALALNEEWARIICDREEQGLDSPPADVDSDVISPLGYSDLIARLDLIADRVMMVRTAVQSTITEKHKEPDFKPLPRPETALDRERERRTREELERLDAQIMGEGLFLMFE